MSLKETRENFSPFSPSRYVWRHHLTASEIKNLIEKFEFNLVLNIKHIYFVFTLHSRHISRELGLIAIMEIRGTSCLHFVIPSHLGLIGHHGNIHLFLLAPADVRAPYRTGHWRFAHGPHFEEDVCTTVIRCPSLNQSCIVRSSKSPMKLN